MWTEKNSAELRRFLKSDTGQKLMEEFEFLQSDDKHYQSDSPDYVIARVAMFHYGQRNITEKIKYLSEFDLLKTKEESE